MKSVKDVWLQRYHDLKKLQGPDWIWEACFSDLITDLGDSIDDAHQDPINKSLVWSEKMRCILTDFGIWVSEKEVQEILDDAAVGIQYLGEIVRRRGLFARRKAQEATNHGEYEGCA